MRQLTAERQTALEVGEAERSRGAMISAQLEAAQRQLRVVQQQAHDHSIEMSSRLASEQACRVSTEAGMAAAEQERLRSGAEAQSAKIKLEEGMQANRGQQTQHDLVSKRFSPFERSLMLRIINLQPNGESFRN